MAQQVSLDRSGGTLYHTPPRKSPFRLSSAVEQLTVNQLVGGSIPPVGAIIVRTLVPHQGFTASVLFYFTLAR